ncbi:hypothetical protein HUB98_16260 [Paenibacillus barcinonensis]|uniref:Uncharacterized protein n=1 Tax=Paenibacillus barcinonensis TaxID=198119 RepID=A0A2V4WBS2_PAEBA|nr:hypothetical protein [Paenibacillus barcinonensis]PYE48887.1 hypothetical protein DFQ00_107180 [Paenibacillus barcinonensis]QKS57699.1 hypothetical protein HUB98_16260 [Paenibacillus barcinonensis]
MNAIKGTSRMIWDDMRLYLTIFSSIALGLTAIYVAIGLLFEISYSSQLFGPMYGGICTFAIAGLLTLYPVAIGMGSTRIQFMKSFYMMGACMVACTMVIQHVIYWTVHLLNTTGWLQVTLLQPGMLYSSRYLLLPYLWIDLMVGFLVLGLSVFLTVCWIRLGLRNFLFLLFGFGLVMSLVVAFGDMRQFTLWVAYQNRMLVFTVLGLIGAALLLSTYPMMKHAPLLRKGSKD